MSLIASEKGRVRVDRAHRVSLRLPNVHSLAAWAVGVQREHVETVRRASLQLAAASL
jgi:hypothetical protein